ncbi:M20/M25/M40 family metallo-hydrolase [Sphingomonas japonica]|uniref:Zn-dependent M28 family amino/carboxypeptidase n=1 Tax=Sphingomonas japonica TaxID=511662 RepID=A0ABX0U412_9SPHN|nr:M20/M25/M40 family metallo-hydrolase [Sphingomonas japonica]NIJ23522.1 Zn-dependent M28 family amino/carboxypeptidase [Sphingomonas japonica]
MIFQSLAIAFVLTASPPVHDVPPALVDDLRTLSSARMQGRAPGTIGSERAREYIADRLRAIGVGPLYNRYERPFAVREPKRTVRGTNLLAVIEGTDMTSDRVVVLGAHYDHWGFRKGKLYPGADDNASGVAGLLAVAAALKADPPRHRTILAFWDGEELGYFGSKAFVADPPVPLDRIALNINLDMISRSDKGELYAVGGQSWPVVQSILDDLAKTAPVTLKFGHEGPPWEGSDVWIDGSDHYQFHLKGIPFVYFGVEDHPDYHQPSDTFDKVPLDFYARSVATVEAAVRAFDAGLDTIPREHVPPPVVDEDD